MEVKMVIENDIDDFEQGIQYYLNNGWELQGNMAFSTRYDPDYERNRDTYIQMMIRNEG